MTVFGILTYVGSALNGMWEYKIQSLVGPKFILLTVTMLVPQQCIVKLHKTSHRLCM
jgi:hypothetical protein